MSRRIEMISIDELIPADRNPKGHSLPVLGSSLDRFGYTEPILIDERTGKIVAGHGRLEALKERRSSGEAPPEGVDDKWAVPVVRGWSSKDDEDASAYLIASNRLTMLGGWDDSELYAVLSELDDLSGVGFTLDELNELAAKIVELPPTPATDPDAVPEAPKTPVTKRGDIWTLGENHRILCGDSRDFSDVEKLMNGQKVNVAFTSPPYASQRKYDESSGFKPISPDEYVEWFEDVQANVRAVLADDGSWFVNIKEHTDDGHRSLYVKDLTIAHARQWGWRYVDELCWDRGSFPGEFPDKFKNGWEPIFHFAQGRIKFRPDAVAHESDGALKYRPEARIALGDDGGGFTKGDVVQQTQGLARPANVVRVGAGTGTGEHTAAFPVGLPSFFIKAYSDPGDNIYDPFMGSGSTLIAAHRENRNAFGCEISPAYCDVIVSRWVENFGGDPIRDDGVKWSELSDQPATKSA